MVRWSALTTRVMAAVVLAAAPLAFSSAASAAPVLAESPAIATGATKIESSTDVTAAAGDVSAQAVGSTFGPLGTAFGNKRIGVISVPNTLTITNSGSTNGLLVNQPVFTNNNIQFGYFLDTTCGTVNTNVTPFVWTPTPIAAGASCEIRFFALPLYPGATTETVTVATNAGSQSYNFSTTGQTGYYLATGSGQLGGYGNTSDQGSGPASYNRPIVGLDATSNGDGVWRVASDGGVFTGGSAEFFGSTGALRLNSPIVGMSQTGSDEGYWLVAADGGVFSFGDAPFLGSMGDKRLNSPIVGMAATPSGEGYWLVAADGGIFNFGDAEFYGSLGAKVLNAPIVGMARTSDGSGYWMVARDGGVFTFGNASFHGSTGAIKLNRPIVGMAPTALGNGYWLVASDGGVFAFDAPFEGSAGNVAGLTDVIGITPSSPQVYLLNA